MKARMRARLGALSGALAISVAAMVSGAGPAAAEDSFSFTFTDISGSDDAVISVRNNTLGATAGSAQWWADPSGGAPGDTLVAYDQLADGYGIEAHLSTGRVATTRGHDSPYIDTTSGDLPEGNIYRMWVCVVKGTFSKCSASYEVRA